MQKHLLGLTLLLPPGAFAQTALKIGDRLPDFVLPRVVNSKTGTFAPALAPGKVLVLEFWSTTCSPCIPALEHLSALQQRHPNELQVVGISPDSEARLQKFLTKRPVAVPLASAPDPKQDINQLFPHRVNPHTVVIDRNQRIVAITSPEQFDEKALGEVVAGRPVHLKVKQDVMNAEPMSFFAMDSTTRYGVNVRPFIQGLPGMMHPERSGPFARRRLTAINVDPVSLFQIAYEVQNQRVLNQLPDSLRQYNDRYLLCFDLIVPPGQEANLRPIMRDELRRYLPVRADTVAVTKAAYVLRRLKAGRPLPTSAAPETHSFNGGEFGMQGGRMSLVRDYLENELNRPVVDETGLTGRYDVAFRIQPENLQPSIAAVLSKLGLELVEESREIQMRRLTPAPAAR